MADWNALRKEYETTGISLAELAEKHGVKYPTIKSRNQREKWKKDASSDADSDASNECEDASKGNKDASTKKKGPPKGNQNAKGHGAPKGNKNAVGNNGGAPSGNKNALRTGEYETIWYDCLTQEEQLLINQIDTDKLAQIEEEIRLISIRQRRMMARIKTLSEGLNEKQRKVLQELQVQKQPVTSYDEATGQSRTVMVPVPEMVVTEVTETEVRCIDDILRVEEALTRIQEKKVRLLALKHTMESSGKGEESSKQAEDHAKRVQEAWANR